MSRRWPENLICITCILPTVLTFWGSTKIYAQDFWSNPQGSSAASSWGLGSGASWNSNWYQPSGSSKQWKLGINGTNTEAGVSVDQVTANSSAARAGINPRDRIVCVAGSQVGKVSGRIFEISEALNRNADSTGRVSMLVQDGRSLQLRAVLVQLEDQQSGLSGTLSVRGGTIPPNSLVTVQLENVSRPLFQIRNGEYSFRIPNYSTGELSFTLNFDPSYIFSSDSYRVRAYITSNGRTLFDTDQPPYVLTNGNPNSVRLLLSPVSYSAANGAAGTGNVVVAAGYMNYDSIRQQVTAAYQRYLGRPPSSIELAAWQQLPDIQYRLSTLPLELMGTQEYFDRAGDNNAIWVEKVFREIVGREPTATELDQWMRRFADLRYSRMELLRQLNSQTAR